MDVLEYIKNYIINSEKDNDVLSKILDAERLGEEDIEPSVGVEVGRFLRLLIQLTQAKRVLEFGTCMGYSTISIAQALKYTGGKVLSVEYDEKRYLMTKKNVEEAGLGNIVELIHGDAVKVADGLTDQFDIILQDADKRIYPSMLETCIRLTRTNGVIIADDTLFKFRGWDRFTSAPLSAYNKLVFNDHRLLSTILPIGDGVTVSVKLSEGFEYGNISSCE